MHDSPASARRSARSTTAPSVFAVLYRLRRASSLSRPTSTLARSLAAGPSGCQRRSAMTRKWRADLETLFIEAGNTIAHGAGGRAETGHEPKHSSRSGECVLLDRDRGSWYCRSCKKGGDAVTFVREMRG